MRKNKMGGPMNLEELRLNKNLLKEINKAKKAEMVSKDRSPRSQLND